MKILDNLLSKFHPGTAEATPTTPKPDQQTKGRVCSPACCRGQC